VDTNSVKMLVEVAEAHGIVASQPTNSEQITKRHETVIKAVRGGAEIEGKHITVTVGLRQGFPCSLPVVFIEPWDAFGVIPHVEADGYVCSAQQEGLILDPNRYKDVLGWVVSSALKQVRRGAQQKNFADFADEFQAYWNRQQGILTIRSFVTPTSEPKLVQAHIKEAHYVRVCDRAEDVAEYRSGNVAQTPTTVKALYIPLRRGTVLVPPHPQYGWPPSDATRAILENIEPSTRTQIIKLSRKLTKQDELVVCHLPRSNGNGGTLFGVKYKGVNKVHPLAGGPTPAAVQAIALDRCDRSFVIPRGGCRESLHAKSVVVVGCGSVGGFLALELARAGIGSFTLIDPESMTAENTYRHVLGRRSLGEKKVSALKQYMEETIPYLQVRDIDNRVEDALASGSLNPSRFDAMVVALGYPPLELYLNRTAAANAHFPPLVFVWVEAFGIGGHVLVSNNRPNGKAAGGCLECLYTALPGDADGLHCRASFAKAGQDFGDNISGCSGLFTPYGSTAAVRAALCATERVVDLLEGKEQGNPLISFKGNADDFVRRGFSLTDRYAMPEQELRSRRYEYVNPACSVCGEHT